MVKKYYYKTVWISDIHLGSRSSKVNELKKFIKNLECDTIYIVGDFVDGILLKRRWYWNKDFNNILRLLLKKSKNGTRIIIIPGNHDEFLYNFVDNDFGNIQIKREDIYHSEISNKKYLIIHGHEFDGFVSKHKIVTKIGCFLYEHILNFNRFFNYIRNVFGLRYYSLAGYIKSKAKNAMIYIYSFEELVCSKASTLGVDCVVCGHIHTPEIKEINNIVYFNDGDWVENMTVLAEKKDGNMMLLNCDDIESGNIKEIKEYKYIE